MTVDPVTVMTTISVGLKLIDQFGDLAKRFMDQQPQPPAETVEQVGNTMELRHYGNVVERRAAEELNLNAWDEVRYRALERRAWVVFSAAPAWHAYSSFRDSRRMFTYIV